MKNFKLKKHLCGFFLYIYFPLPLTLLQGKEMRDSSVILSPSFYSEVADGGGSKARQACTEASKQASKQPSPPVIFHSQNGKVKGSTLGGGKRRKRRIGGGKRERESQGRLAKPSHPLSLFLPLLTTPPLATNHQHHLQRHPPLSSFAIPTNNGSAHLLMGCPNPRAADNRVCKK